MTLRGLENSNLKLKNFHHISMIYIVEKEK